MDMDIEDLMMSTLDAVSRFRIGQREAVIAALDAGGLLIQAKGRLRHGEWGDWLERLGLNARTARAWMRLSGMGLSAAEVIARGGIRATLAGNAPKETATVADSRADRARELEAAEAAVGIAKRAYYDALTARQKAMRALAREQE